MPVPDRERAGTYKNVVEAFMAVPREGRKRKVEGGLPTQLHFPNHFQGIARVNGRTYLSHNHYWKDFGWLVVVDDATDKVLSTVKTKEITGHYNHPGSIQACGSILTVGVENQSNDKAHVFFYDVSDPTPKLAPVSIELPNTGAGMAALVDVEDPDKKVRHLLATFDDGVAVFRLSNGESLMSESLTWSEVFRATLADENGKGASGDSLQLLREDSGKLFMAVGFGTGGEAPTEDHVRLYPVPSPFAKQPDAIALKLRPVESRHMVTKHGVSTAEVIGLSLASPETALAAGIETRVRFRWAFGVERLSSSSMGFLSSQADVYKNEFWLNEFYSDAVEVQVGEKSVVPLEILVHIQDEGDRTFKAAELAGTVGKQRRVEGFQINLPPSAPGLGLEYMGHLQDVGDTDWVKDGMYVGTRGQSRRLEGFAIRLTGRAKDKFRIEYGARLDKNESTPVAADGEFCGTRGKSRPLEALFVRIVNKG